MAGDLLPRCPVYHLECVDTHRVHVSFTGIFPPGLWSSFLSSSCYVCHHYSFRCVLFVPSHHCPDHISRFSVIFCMFVLLWLFLQSCLSLAFETSMSTSSSHSSLSTALFLSMLLNIKIDRNSIGLLFQ